MFERLRLYFIYVRRRAEDERGRNHASPVNGGMFCNDRGTGSLPKWMVRVFQTQIENVVYSLFLLHVYCFCNTGVVLLSILLIKPT
jgi:hypothetical protein